MTFYESVLIRLILHMRAGHIVSMRVHTFSHHQHGIYSILILSPLLIQRHMDIVWYVSVCICVCV